MLVRMALLPTLALLSTLPLLTPQVNQDDEYLSGDVNIEGVSYPYSLLPPKKLVKGKRYPLVLFLHGSGERGTDNESPKTHFPEVMRQEKNRKSYPCYVLSPQCPEHKRWVEVDWGERESSPLSATASDPMRAAIAALEEVIRTHQVDPDQIILTGLSMGGYGAWDLSARHAGWFSAAAAICGGGDEHIAANFAGLPMHVWHGTDDDVVPTVRSQMMVNALRALNLEVSYTELPGIGHDSWQQAYAEGGCLEKLFSTKRDPAKRQSLSARLLADVIQADERIAFLGDSITQAGNRQNGYVDLIRDVLKKEQRKAKVIPAGISGHKVPDLLARFKRDVIDKKATLVFIYIGINDVWHSTSGNGTSAEDFEAGLHTLIQDLRSSGADVVLATPSVIGERPHGENSLDALLTEYAAISRKVAATEGVVLCDLQKAFQSHLGVFNPEDKDKGVLTSDGVHLNAAGNVFLATESARALREAVLARD